jgi:N utilization substance protein A
MNAPIVEAIAQIIREKKIEREVFQDIIQNVFLAMIKKKYGSSDNFDVIFNLDKGDIEIFCEKTVVSDEEFEDEVTQIPLLRAQEIDEDLELGEIFAEQVDYNAFGRRLVTSARQNLAQKIKEIEKENLYQEFSARIGEIVSGDIRQINRREIRINVDRTEVTLPKAEQVYNERYRRGETIRMIIKEVNRTTKEPEIVVSRADTSFVRRLFELEVPEIYDNIIEIKDIVREPGDRTKIAVLSNDKRIDPIGACVGMKGVRIQAVVRELNNEKIDVIHWHPDPETFVKRSMAPVTPLMVLLDEDNRRATAIVPDDMIQFAIGKKGQNIRLASQLTKFQIEPIKETEYSAAAELSIDEVDGLSPAIIELLKGAGFTTADAVLDAGHEKLMEIPGIGEVRADETITLLESYFEEIDENSLNEESDEEPSDDKEA